MPEKLHENEVDTSPELVRRLLAEQFPAWAGLEIAPEPLGGTDNVMFRLGEDLAVRLPRTERTRSQIELDARWLPVFADVVPLAVPVPIAVGEPGAGYPFPWAVVPWLPGDVADVAEFDQDVAAEDLAAFTKALQTIDAADGPRPSWSNAGRGMSIRRMDEPIRGMIAGLDRGEFDVDVLQEMWDAAVRAPKWDRPPVWVHGDLQPDNVLVSEGRLSAVLDFGCMAVGDPAVELQPAWNMFSGRSREIFRSAMGLDDAAWARARGWILMPAVNGLSYYADTSPAMVARSRRALEVVVDEFARA